MTSIIAPRSIALLPVLLSVSAGCATTFGDQTTASGVTTTTLDQTLPNALEELWGTCQQDFLIFADDTSIDLAGTCNSIPTSTSSAAQTLWLAVAANGELAIDIPETLFNERAEFADFAWPLQNCYVVADTEVHFGVLGFDTLAASWVQHDGHPALKVRLGNPDATWGYAPVWRSTIA